MLPSPSSGSWDSIHVFESHERGRTASYKLTSTVMLQLVSKSAEGDENVELAGSLTRQTDLDNVPLRAQGDHVPNLGRMIEDMEIKLRNLLSEVYFVSPFCNDVDEVPMGDAVADADSNRPARDALLFYPQGKTKDVLNDVRSFGGLERKSKEDALRRELVCSGRSFICACRTFAAHPLIDRLTLIISP